ncbi:MAG TPA: hypothetical protein VJ734_01380 [Nitrosospira sp.]|nr:hypothetical protein [Nitrosospira sp.]
MEQKKDSHNLIEKITFSFGLAALLVLLSYLVYQSIQEKKGPPQLVITTAPQPGMEHHGFQVRIENIGEETAKSVNLKMNLYRNGKSIESGIISTKFVPAKSVEIAWIVFHQEKNPDDSLVVSSVTYL